MFELEIGHPGVLASSVLFLTQLAKLSISQSFNICFFICKIAKINKRSRFSGHATYIFSMMLLHEYSPLFFSMLFKHIILLMCSKSKSLL